MQFTIRNTHFHANFPSAKASALQFVCEMSPLGARDAVLNTHKHTAHTKLYSTQQKHIRSREWYSE